MSMIRSAFEVQGHRGARGLFPENTLDGIAATMALGVDAVEIDIGVTADGVAVLCHDVALNPDLARDASGAWIEPPGALISRLTRADLAAYDVGRLRPGSPTALRHPDQTPMDGARIPTLAEVLALTAAAGMRLDVELKSVPDRPEATVSPIAMLDTVLRIVDDATGPALINRGLIDLRAFDWRGLIECRARHPDIPLTWLTNAETAANPGLWWGRERTGSVPAMVAAAGGGTWAPDHADLTEADIAEAHALGLRVVPWTVNAADDIARLIDWGADGVCTDRPDIARLVMAAKGLPVPPAIPRG
jgi:glycerophosphoryl diester phosphodiesterase